MASDITIHRADVQTVGEASWKVAFMATVDGWEVTGDARRVGNAGLAITSMTITRGHEFEADVITQRTLREVRIGELLRKLTERIEEDHALDVAMGKPSKVRQKVADESRPPEPKRGRPAISDDELRHFVETGLQIQAEGHAGTFHEATAIRLGWEEWQTGRVKDWAVRARKAGWLAAATSQGARGWEPGLRLLEARQNERVTRKARR